MNTLLHLGFLQVIPVRRPWTEVGKAAVTNYFALVAFAVILAGFWLLFRTKGWRKVVGTLAVLAGASLMMMVLHDIRSEIPLSRVGTKSSQIALPARSGPPVTVLAAVA
jgi:hypothetical protein